MNKIIAIFLMTLIINTIPILLAFSLTYKLFRRFRSIEAEQEADKLSRRVVIELQRALPSSLIASPPDVEFYPIFGQVPWIQLISTSVEIDIFVHYFDVWLDEHVNTLQAFLDKGGKIRIILPNPENDVLISVIKQRFPELQNGEIKKKIEQTRLRLLALQENTIHRDASIEIHYVDLMILYCAVRFDRDQLVVSTYEHERRGRVDAPAIVIPLVKYEHSEKWIEKEFTNLYRKAIRKENLRRVARDKR